MYEGFKASDLIYIIGFGFNIDDEHINGIIRTLIDIEDKRIVVVDTDPETTPEKIALKLKTNRVENIYVLTTDKQRKICDKNWLQHLI